MARTQAFTQYIEPNGGEGNTSELGLVHQSSPSWVLTFVRWNVRDTLRSIGGSTADLLAVRDPLVVENDCIQLSVNSNKSVLTPGMRATLVITDVNYATAVAPGDFVFVNILNWENDARTVAEIGRTNSGQLNLPEHGFKGIYKIQSVRKGAAVVDPVTGAKKVSVNIEGYAFTEFNNKIYYNPYLDRNNQGTAKDGLLFAGNIQADYQKLITPDHNPYCQDLIKFLIQSFIGNGVTDQGVTVAANNIVTANTHFFIPQQIGKFLGISGAKAAKDVYNYLFGIQLYSASQNQDLKTGMNPSNIKNTNGRFSYTNIFCGGQSLLKPDYWNQATAWSILNQYTNSPLNEMYSCFRVDTTGKIMPTIVFRQIPFTTDYFGKAEPFNIQAKVTRFSTIPRWKVSSALVLAQNIGRDESARINFVQYYVQPPQGVGKPEAFISAQTASGNYVYDIADVQRSGLRPYIVTSNFEDLTITKDEFVAKRWAYIIGDSLMGGHLKLNGTIDCAGIVDPIAVGDNLEYDDTVFHIEDITHNCIINPNGTKMFRTMIKMSNGVSVSTTGTGVQYGEMEHTNAYMDRKDNYENGNAVLPGVSEEQNIPSRQGSYAPDQNQIDSKDRPFAQPGQLIKPNPRTEENE